jgi:hypothetical protein
MIYSKISSVGLYNFPSKEKYIYCQYRLKWKKFTYLKKYERLAYFKIYTEIIGEASKRKEK